MRREGPVPAGGPAGGSQAAGPGPTERAERPVEGAGGKTGPRREAGGARAAAASTRWRRALGPLLLLAAAGYLYWRAGDIPVVPVPGQLGPDFWPRLGLTGLALACVAKLVALWRAPAATGERPSAAAAAPEAVEARPALDGRRLALALTLLVLYVASSPVVGFALANTLFLAAFMWLAGLRRPWPVAGLAVGLTVAFLYLFVRVVYVPLPRGSGVFLDATLALYRLLGLF